MQNNLLPKSKAALVFEILAATWPEAHCELTHNNDFQLLIAVVLSAQATDKSVNKALAPLLLKNPYFSASDLQELGESQFLQVIRSVGLAPTKAKNCFNLANILLEKYAGKVPCDRHALESLPGVGRKTANVVLNVLFKWPTMAVDTHVERVSKRLGLVPVTANRLQVEENLLLLIPPPFLIQAHHFLIFHGRYTCLARSPRCEICPLEKICMKNI